MDTEAREEARQSRKVGRAAAPSFRRQRVMEGACLRGRRPPSLIDGLKNWRCEMMSCREFINDRLDASEGRRGAAAKRISCACSAAS